MIPCALTPAEDASHADTVLLVDDEPALLDIYAAVLRRHFDIEQAGSAKEADVWLGQKAFKVIVADHLMPGETGLSFLSRTRKAFPHVQCVMVTGNMTPEMQRSARETNLLFAFLVKPISITELLSVVQSAVKVHDASLTAAK